jgi:hypothetical protein
MVVLMYWVERRDGKRNNLKTLMKEHAFPFLPALGAAMYTLK